MNRHKHARSSPRGRALLVDRSLVHGLRTAEATPAAGVNANVAKASGGNAWEMKKPCA